MDAHLREVLDLFVRWLHLIAGIMWIGNSMLFNWLDRSLKKDPGDDAHLIGREYWMHGGGFYTVEKRTMPDGQLPPWFKIFKWQSYTTWLSGFALMIIVYYLTAGILVDPAIMPMSHGTAVAIGLGVLVGGFFAYDLLWRSPFRKLGMPAVVISYGLLIAVAYGLTLIFSPRAAFMHVGALMGTFMAGNVFFHIIPAQKALVAKLQGGGAHDMELGAAAKQRSIHNNYLTFPMLFFMLSNHFPTAYGHHLNWLVLGALIVGGTLTRHFMNIRWQFKSWLPAMGGSIAATAVAVAVLTAMPAPPRAGAPEVTAPVAFAQVHPVITSRCATCHSAKPTDPAFAAPAAGVAFDTPEQIQSLAGRIHARSVASTTMPMANKTGMTEEERALIGAWIKQGAKLQ